MTRRLLLVAPFILAACGGGTADDSAGETAVTDPPPEVSAEPAAEPPPEDDSEIESEDDSEVAAAAAPAPAQTITSADGMVSLAVPAGAVPPGTEITIEPVAAREGVRAAYEFGPDGLQFDTPAELEWRLALPADSTGAFSLGFVLDDGTVEFLVGTAARLTDDGLTLSADIEHFTEFLVLESPGFHQVRPDGPVLVGEVFSFEVEVEGPSDYLVTIYPDSDAPVAENVVPFYKCETVGVIEFGAWILAIGDFGPDQPDERHGLITLRAECIDGGLTALTLEPSGPDVDEFPGTVEMAVTDESISFAFGPDAMARAEDGSVGVSMVGYNGERYADCYIETQTAAICAVVDGTGQFVGSATSTFELGSDGSSRLDIPAGALSAEDGGIVVDLAGDPFPLGELFVNVYDAAGEVSENKVAPRSVYELLGPGMPFNADRFR